MARGKRGEGPNKAQLVRDAVAVLGADAKPLAIQKEIKEKAGVDMSTQMISTYKSMMAKKGGKARKAKAGGRAAKEDRVPGKVNIADDIVLIRKLVGRLGATQVHQLIDVLT